MPNALVFNPGSNSLKFEVVETAAGQRFASEAHKQVSAAIEDFGETATLTVVHELRGRGREVEKKEQVEVPDMGAAARYAVGWLSEQGVLDGLGFAAVRVVHGGARFAGATRATAEVRQEIEALEELAPLHNKSAVEILKELDAALKDVPLMVTFDTAFHRTLPEVAWRYAIEAGTADRWGVRKFGFHGLSHRYMLEQYAKTVGKPVDEVSLVTLHLESGSSATAILKGRSVDTTMGLTPLEGLMMGTRSGSVDPAIVPYLMEKEGVDVAEVMTLLEKKSGLLGIAGGSLDTRVLVKRGDDAARLALAMFGYRVRLAVGAYLAALGDAVDAVIFGGGIGENSPWLRAAVAEGLRGFGLEFDAELNEQSVEGQVKLSKQGSRLGAWSMPVEEGLQMALECRRAIEAEGG